MNKIQNIEQNLFGDLIFGDYLEFEICNLEFNGINPINKNIYIKIPGFLLVIIVPITRIFLRPLPFVIFPANFLPDCWIAHIKETKKKAS